MLKNFTKRLLSTFQIDGKMLKFTFNVEHQNNFHNFSSLFNVIFISAET